MTMSNPETPSEFMRLYRERCPDGACCIPDYIDDATDTWHDEPGHQSLHEYLGMTWWQYQAWAERGEVPS